MVHPRRLFVRKPLYWLKFPGHARVDAVGVARELT